MHIKLPNGVIIEDASEELVRAVLAAPSLALLGGTALATSKTADKKTDPAPVAEAPATEVTPVEKKKKKMHPLNALHVPSENFDPLPAIVKAIRGSHRIAKTEMFLVLKELNTCGRALAPKEVRDRLRRFECFSVLKDAAIYHALTMLVRYGAVIKKAEAAYIIAPEVIGASDDDLLALIDSHDTPEEWARINFHK